MLFFIFPLKIKRKNNKKRLRFRYAPLSNPQRIDRTDNEPKIKAKKLEKFLLSKTSTNNIKNKTKGKSRLGNRCISQILKLDKLNITKLNNKKDNIFLFSPKRNFFVI